MVDLLNHHDSRHKWSDTNGETLECFYWVNNAQRTFELLYKQ